MVLVENVAENIQGKKEFAKFRMLQIEEGKHVYDIHTFATLTFRLFSDWSRNKKVLRTEP